MTIHDAYRTKEPSNITGVPGGSVVSVLGLMAFVSKYQCFEIHIGGDFLGFCFLLFNSHSCFIMVFFF